MGTQQSLLTILAMMLLTMLAVRMNSNILRTQDITQNSKFGLTAISLATSRIELATRLAFDENTYNNPLTSTALLTFPASFGVDSGEVSAAQFDDIDDYHNFTETDSSLPSAVYTITSKTEYLEPVNLTGSTTPTWHKQFTVYVSSSSMQDTVVMSTVLSYWYFR
ncbi:MAG: hypothetical protein IT279_13920 [Ignavibacteriaceae bacterium]|nr:hypothetical protein [Ignavibacteriaceae bacterium]